MTKKEKIEFLYFTPYYLQSFFFLIGTSFWILAELLNQHPSFWTAAFGWSLIISNFLALPLMNLSGLYLEQTAREDFTGIFSFIVLSYIITPFQAYAAIKGLLEKDESGWIRTLKTGSITDRVLQVSLRRHFKWILPRRKSSRGNSGEVSNRKRMVSVFNLVLIIIMSSLIILVTATAISTPEEIHYSTALSFEYLNSPVNINLINTNRVLTHPDYTCLGKLHTDSFSIQNEWKKAWGFYLNGPLVEIFNMRGEIKAILFLYANTNFIADIRFVLLDVDQNGGAIEVTSTRLNDINLDCNLSKSPVNISLEIEKSMKFAEGHSICAEIWIKSENSCDQDTTVYFAYDSYIARSRIELPGIVMPESLLSFLFIAPIIPFIIKKTRRIDMTKKEEVI
jgi:hypothetical protein